MLQNNGRIAHQEVDHVHFHMVSLPNLAAHLLQNEEILELDLHTEDFGGGLADVFDGPRSRNRIMRRACRSVGRSRKRIWIS